ncbi:hypothetical protein LshimejAT787_1104200 [Lyophyllum shimeji]|uniref:Uncharacterized protein n=1 Tax=Lyophyllum shimeji TaxID=47721 RepID=A0A9P3PT90_LYOSH|nr:hypothetical protein LshimejAT787_1104200 [Lyophyllum shimeji]
MVLLGSGYVMKAELGMKIAAKLGIDPEDNDVLNARVHINRYTQARIPNFPMLRAIVYTPFRPGDAFAYILVTRQEDDNPKRKFKERPLDLRVKRAFMRLGELEEGDIQWDTQQQKRPSAVHHRHARIAVGLSNQFGARRTVLPTLHGNMPYTLPTEELVDSLCNVIRQYVSSYIHLSVPRPQRCGLERPNPHGTNASLYFESSLNF